MKTAILVLIVFCFCPYFARGELARPELVERVESARGELVESARADTGVFPANCSSPVPDISGWTIAQTSRIEFRLSDEVVAYLGLAIEYSEYSNPSDPGESILVVSRHVPMVFQKQKPTNDQLFREVATALYTQKEEQDRLAELDKKTDPILYIKWRTKKNPRTMGDKKDGDINIWFLRSTGECGLVQNKRVGVEFLTENVGNGKPRNVFVGVKYQVGDSYHILKVDRNDVVRFFEGGK